MSVNTRVTALLIPLLAMLAFAGSASAETPAPGFAVIGRTTPTELPPGGEGMITLFVGNLGGARAEGGARLTDTLPEGLTATEAQVTTQGGTGYTQCEVLSATHVTCESSIFNLYPDSWRSVYIRVKVGTGVPVGAVDTATISGGGALEPASTTVPVSVGENQLSSGFNGFSAWLTNANGTPDTQAGSHPYDMDLAFALNNVLALPLQDFPNTPEAVGYPIGGDEHPAGGQVQGVNVNLPAGLVGDPQAVPRCPRVDLDTGYEGDCPPDTQVGKNEADIEGNGLVANSAVFNMVPPPGVAAQFAFVQSGTIVFLDAGVRTGGDNGVTTHAIRLPRRSITFDRTTIWGVPAEASHDIERCEAIAGGYEVLPECEDHEPAKALLTLPTSCGAPLEFSAEIAGTWEEPALTSPLVSTFTHNDTGAPIGLTGCQRLQPFKPSISVTPDTTYADTPAGLSVDVSMPEGLNPEGLSTPNLKDTKVVLPEGIVINPGQAKGLVACQPTQEALGKEPDGEVNEHAPSCPEASRVGTVEIETPLLRDKMQGNVYILQKNPPNLELMLAASADGVNLKPVGQVDLNETTGQLTSTFNETPDLPFTNFRLNFSGGAQAALATPTSCGTYASNVAFTPWSAPFIEEAFDSSRFQITNGPANGGSCGSTLPFNPTLTAGATTDQAGGYTNFSMLLQRGDGQQRIDALQFKAPAGLTGFLSHVPLCTNTQAETNTCPEASKIGHTIVESGPGPYPLVIPEPGQEPAPIYLTEAYGGAPFGLSIVVPLHVGPFTLETQRVRARIEISPTTSALTITTNPLPQEVAGIPTDLREVDAVIERPEFMVNPTNCNPQEFTGTAYGTPPPGQNGTGASAPISSHFQVGSCQALKFEPKLTAATNGKTSKTDGASLTYKIAYPNVPQGTDADIHYVKVELPGELPSRLTTLQKACTAKVFQANPAGCPKESVIGHAVVHTPLLPVPLQGPVYFVSNGGEAFPNLEMVLQGDGVTIELVGDTLIKKGVTSTTFKAVPDDPFSSFEITLGQGPYSALAANGNLCKPTKTETVKKKVKVNVKGHERTLTRKVKQQVATPLTIPSDYTAQNGATYSAKVPVTVTGCPKAKAVKKAKKKGKGKKKK